MYYRIKYFFGRSKQIKYFKLLIRINLISYILLSIFFTSCNQDSNSSSNDTTLILLYSQNEFLLDVSNDTIGTYYKDTIWTHSDATLNNIRVTFLAEVDTLSSNCSISFFLYYFVDSAHQHINTYSQFGRENINGTHQIDLSVRQFRNYLLYYQFQLFIHKKTNYSPAYIRFRDIRIYKAVP